jgi:glycosyltransferase involved in cell wall biosynthesis
LLAALLGFFSKNGSDSKTMSFSLILATVGRTEEPARFLQHLDLQTYRHFELIVVDQNPGAILDPLIRQYQDRFPLLHLRSECGLSRARNAGLQHASGDMVAFPDDDGWYPADLLQRVASFFQWNPSIDGVTGRCVDGSGGDSSRFDRRSGWINRFNVWTRSNSHTIFLRREVSQLVGPFDERLGVGAKTPYGSGEETDYLLRALAHRRRLFYDSSLLVYHPQLIRLMDARECARGRAYARGTGHVLRRHRYPLWFPLYQITRSLGGAAVSAMGLDFATARFRLNILIGRTWGWIAKESRNYSSEWR